jgi:GTP-binding protein
MFVDTAKIQVSAGNGGDGRLSFRHEKYRALGGPDGGDGGRGGNVVLRAGHNQNTLASYRTARRIKAEDGQAGGGDRKHGRAGADVTLDVPEGTQVWEGDRLVADLTADGQTAVIARGGRGGFGNAHFKSSTRQAPRAAELGEKGETFKLRLELKLVADVGLVGLPNAGKSTLLSVISSAKPEIADYPFTTLVPNLGVVDAPGGGFLAADIPGLIEGASEGKGLGDQFLRHIERTAVLLHLVDGASDNVAADRDTIEKELSAYSPELHTKPRLTVLTKIDGLTNQEVAAKLKALGGKPFAISAQAHTGLQPLLAAVSELVAQARTERRAVESELPVIDVAALPDLWSVEPDGEGAFRITGTRLEGFARRTNFDQDEAVARLRDILRKNGVARELHRLGAQPGDTIRIAGQEFAWLE